MADARSNAIVTGAASGLGRALAVRLAADGWRIALADIDQIGTAETLRLVEAAGGVGQIEHLNVTRFDQWQDLHTRLRGDWSQLDLLVNNAGLGADGDLGVFPLDDWRLVMNVNLCGTIYGCHVFVDWLKSNPHGAYIINTASFAALAPSPSMAAYNVAKAGVVALSETLYAELKPHGVGVSVICPMYFRTGIQRASRSYCEITRETIEERMKDSKLTAESVASDAIQGMARNVLYVVSGRQARWYWWLRRLMPVGFLDGIAKDHARRQSLQRKA